MTFADFSKSNFINGKNSDIQSQASSVFFKFNEITQSVGSHKDTFLAYAFCINGGGKTCQ